MRITLNVDDAVVNEAIEESGIKNKTYLITLSLNEFLKKIKREKLKALRGKIKLDLDLDEIRNRDILK